MIADLTSWIRKGLELEEEVQNRQKIGNLRIVVVLLVIGLVLFSNSCTLPGKYPEAQTEKVTENLGGSNQEPADDKSLEGESPQIEIINPGLGSTQPWIDSSLLVYIPPGEFIMGGDQLNNPEQVVYLDGFWIYRTEVTNRMYLNCIAMGNCSPPAVDPALPNIEDPDLVDYPVIGLTWFQANEYCEFVSGSLPTEAQWEKAARFTDGRPFPWGTTEPTCELLNFNDCFGEISPVNAYIGGSSPYGMLDMAGNVFEWVADWYQEDYYSSEHFDNPMGPDFGEVRSIRGSTYASDTSQILLPLRYFLEPDNYRTDLGFRCVVSNAEQYAPPCEVLAQSDPDWLGENPTEGPGGSAACVVPQPELSVVTYCESGQRGYNISWSPSDAEINYQIQENAWCSQYDQDTLACAGEYGATVNIEACKSCLPPQVDLGVIATCESPYVYDEDSRLCVYDGPPVPERALCPPGYSLRGDDSCCVQQDRTPLDFPICPVGGVFDSTSMICWFRLPSTGDEKCVSQSIFFQWCPGDREEKPGQSPDPCSIYDINQCRNNKDSCHWDYDQGVCLSN